MAKRPFQKRKAFGQHFLKDRKVIDAVVSSAFHQVDLHGAHTLLEIGPGKGAITEPLLERWEEKPSLRSFRIVEKDRDLAAHWVERSQARESDIKTVTGDFLHVDLPSLLKNSPTVVVSNLPYSAGTAILLRLCDHGEKIPAMTLMFQAEVGRRLRAQPRTKDWGSLSLWVQNFWEVQLLIPVPPSAFSPPPQVQSEVVTLLRRPVPLLPEAAQHPQRWQELLQWAFRHKRKMLRSNFSSSPWKEILLESGVEPTLRAEALSWEDWGRLFRAALTHR